VITGLHARLVALYGWEPDRVWRLTLPDALRFERARVRVVAIAAQLVSAAVWLPMAGSDGASTAGMFERLCADPTDQPRTLAEELGPTVAREVAELDARNRAWLEKRAKE